MSPRRQDSDTLSFLSRPLLQTLSIFTSSPHRTAIYRIYRFRFRFRSPNRPTVRQFVVITQSNGPLSPTTPTTNDCTRPDQTMPSNRNASPLASQQAQLTVYKDARLHLHNPAPRQPMHMIQMRRLSRYSDHDVYLSLSHNSTTNSTSSNSDSNSFSLYSSTITTNDSMSLSMGVGGGGGDSAPETPVAGYFNPDFSFGAMFGATPEWFALPEPQPDPELETLIPDADLFDGLYGVDVGADVGVGLGTGCERPMSTNRAAYASRGRAMGDAGYDYAGYAGSVGGAAARHHHHRRQGQQDREWGWDIPFPESAQFSSDFDHANDFAYAYAYAQQQQQQQQQQYSADHDFFSHYHNHHHVSTGSSSRRNTASRHQPSNSLVLRGVREQERLSPSEWRVFNEARIHAAEDG
ncbi:uncharacterized protein IWZ02DRAFT_290281 [Phyllosticta citriasiana]|uniref:uncharacterized protein n=1 Tax=Phyllosticta citriasiana TaxID=595635 RepID=UPI0030FD92B9